MRPPLASPEVPAQLDRELLAWAAGFFDGEGTALAKRDRSRPGYVRLDVSVRQGGKSGPPAVPLKFQRAMLSVGHVTGPDQKGLYRWRVTNRVGAENTLALLWSYLRAVKRGQALEALARVRQQYESGRYRARRGRASRLLTPHGQGDLRSGPRRRDLAWAAGFLDAEGCFGITRVKARKDRTPRLRIRVSASQHGETGVPAEVLMQLKDIPRVGRIDCHGEPDDFRWVVEGKRVGPVLELLRPSLRAVKIDQAQTALDRYASRSRARGDSERCIRGHT